jgi:hypothetical protein
MSAVATPAEALQAELPAMPAAPPPTPSQTPAHPVTAAAQCERSEPLKLCVRGHLAAPARLIDDPQHLGRVLLEVVLHQHVDRHPRAVPLVAVWAYPDFIRLPTAYARALALAQRLPEGTETLVLGRGLETGHHHGEPCLRVIDVMGIRPASEPGLPLNANDAQGALC